MFLVDNSKFQDLDLSPHILRLRIISLSSKKVFLMVIVNIKIYERTNFKRDHVIMCEHLLYEYIYIHVCMYVYLYVYMYMYVMHI